MCCMGFRIENPGGSQQALEHGELLSTAGDSHAFVRPPVHPMERIDRQALTPNHGLRRHAAKPDVPAGHNTRFGGAVTLLHVPAVRMATIHAAMANIVDTADWFIHTRHYWLWAFAEQGLVFAQNSALGRITNPNDATSGGPGGLYGSVVEGPNGGMLPLLAASSPATSAPAPHNFRFGPHRLSAKKSLRKKPEVTSGKHRRASSAHEVLLRIHEVTFSVSWIKLTLSPQAGGGAMAHHTLQEN
ncbi:hypothetical protein BKA62DRAFT_786710 [Auriculariales sp. MPI-PUGE-AT-0066]|nr:hypothetical protein BKA62DRAFT_786710 [Auriculariales sp. MPI-PUGE-AT-0066]